MPNHGVYVTERSTAVSTPVAVETGIPFFIGAAPVHKAENPATAGIPKLCTSLTEFREAFGYSEDWNTYGLCEAAYSHFVLFGMAPAIFVNLLNPATMKTAVAAADKAVASKLITLTETGIIDNGLVVKAAGGEGNALVKGTDYDAYYDADGKLTIEVLSGGAAYTAESLNVAYNTVNAAAVTAAAVATGLESIDLCMGKLGVIPDLIVAPGFSQEAAVAAAMIAKAGSINGMFQARAIVDISTTTAPTYDTVIAAKNAANLTDKRALVCWPMFKLGDKIYHASTQVAGTIAVTDSNYDAPYASPSNHAIQADSLVKADGTEIILSKAQADVLNAGGVITALNFMGGFRLWGNYTGAYPSSTDVKDIFIPVGRMFDWVNNTLIQTFWSRLDEPMTRVFLDSIVDTCNIWMNGLVGSGYLLGGRVEMFSEENPPEKLMQGIVKLHVYMTPPSPAQEIDFVLEYDASYVAAAFE